MATVTSTTQLNVPLPTPIYRALKLLATQRNAKLYALVEEALTAYLKARKAA